MISFIAVMNGILNMDHSILLAIQEHLRLPLLIPFFKVVTTLGNAGFIWIFITLLLLIRKDTRKVGILCACSLLGSLLINNIILKNLVCRMRPYDRFEDLIPLVKKPTDYSFPSGHTGSSFACASVLFAKFPKKYGIPALILASLIAVSRLFVGVHYPTDVLVGLITGLFIGFGVCFLEKNIVGKKRRKKQ